jgi:hypothetical protein
LAGAVPARRLISIGIGIDIVLIVGVLLSGGFKIHLPWFTIRVHSLFIPLMVLAGLSFARALIARNRGKSLLLFFSLLLTFITLEAGVRVLSVVLHRKSVAGLRSSREITSPPRDGQELSLGDFIQTSVNPDIVYELVPGVAARFLGKKLTINRYGFRGTPYPPRPDRGAVRIVGIGDSVMFGWGVADGEPYLSVLGRELAAAYPHTRWQIINAAVPGYNTYMEVATLEDRLLGYAPDLVIIDYVGNDQDLPNFLQNKISPFSLQRSFLLDLIRAKVRGLAWRGLDRLVDAPRDPFGESFSSDPGRVPPVYGKMVGLEAVLRSMDRLKQLSEKHDFAVVVFSTGTVSGRLRQHIDKLGFPVLEARLWHLGRSDRRACSGSSAVLAACRYFDRWLAATGFHSYGDSPLTVSPTDPHPSAMTHQALGSMLFRYLKNSGWIETERRRPERSSQKFPHEGTERPGGIDLHEVAGTFYNGYL